MTRTRALTARERAAVLLAGEGCSNREIARRMGVTMHTANDFLDHAYAKLGVSGRGSPRTRAVVALWRQGRAGAGRTA